MFGCVPRKKGKHVLTTPSPQSTNPLSHDRVIEALISTLTPEQQSELVREALARKLAESPMSELLGLKTAPRSFSATPGTTHAREAKDYLGGIVDVTVVSNDKVKSNKARVILADREGRHYMWDATSADGIALKAGDKRRITATVDGKEGGHVLISRVRFYDKSAKAPVRFSR
jgi:hypothetical protein